VGGHGTGCGHSGQGSVAWQAVKRTANTNKNNPEPIDLPERIVYPSLIPMKSFTWAIFQNSWAEFILPYNEIGINEIYRDILPALKVLEYNPPHSEASMTAGWQLSPLNDNDNNGSPRAGGFRLSQR
jgi:hypothetical protein